MKLTADEVNAIRGVLTRRLTATRTDLKTSVGQFVNAYLSDVISGFDEGREGYDEKALDTAYRVSQRYEGLLEIILPKSGAIELGPVTAANLVTLIHRIIDQRTLDRKKALVLLASAVDELEGGPGDGNKLAAEVIRNEILPKVQVQGGWD